MSDGGVSMELVLDQKNMLKQRAEKAESEAKEVSMENNSQKFHIFSYDVN